MLSCVVATIRGFVFLVSCATVFHNICRCSVFFVLFSQNGRLFVFLRNVHSSIEILKIKILEYSYPPSQYFFVTKAYIRFLLCRRKVALCQSGRMAHEKELDHRNNNNNNKNNNNNNNDNNNNNNNNNNNEGFRISSRGIDSLSLLVY